MRVLFKIFQINSYRQANVKNEGEKCGRNSHYPEKFEKNDQVFP